MTDKKTVTLFADGAGAVILSATENLNRGFLASELYTEGQYHDWMGIYAGGNSSADYTRSYFAERSSVKICKKISQRN